jgi:hypothetical protein
MKKIAITFGTDHNKIHAGILGTPHASEGYVVIEAPAWRNARDIAFAIFGEKFAFDYDIEGSSWLADIEQKGYYPAGELLRIAWIGMNARSAITWTIDNTYEAADGDSNDEEIEALQDARDLLAEIIDYIPEERS